MDLVTELVGDSRFDENFSDDEAYIPEEGINDNDSDAMDYDDKENY